MDTPQYVYPLTFWWTFGSFPVWGYCKSSCHKYFMYSDLCTHPFISLGWILGIEWWEHLIRVFPINTHSHQVLIFAHMWVGFKVAPKKIISQDQLCFTNEPNRTRDMEVKNKLTVTRMWGEADTGDSRGRGKPRNINRRLMARDNGRDWLWKCGRGWGRREQLRKRWDNCNWTTIKKIDYVLK